MLSFGDRWQCMLELTFNMSLWVRILDCVPASSKKVKKEYEAKILSRILNVKKEKLVNPYQDIELIIYWEIIWYEKDLSHRFENKMISQSKKKKLKFKYVHMKDAKICVNHDGS